MMNPSASNFPSTPHTLAFDQARLQILNAARSEQPTEHCKLDKTLGRVLAQDVTSPLNVPGFDNSAMDGYALHVVDFSSDLPIFKIVQRIMAGQVGVALAANHAARIFTGAAIPSGCNAIVPQEDVTVTDQMVQVHKLIKANQHIRRTGEDITSGTLLIHAGTRLAPQHVAMLASVGLAEIEVYQPLTVSLLFTGDELVEPGEPLAAGSIYNSNRYAIQALLEKIGCVVKSIEVIKDNAEQTQRALLQASKNADVILTCGGVSVGEADHVRAAVQALGHLDIWQIAMKPGKPLAFGRIGEADFIGLPGNPVSAFLTFLLLARPLLLKRSGRTDTDLSSFLVKADFDWPAQKGRTEFLRVRCTHHPNGEITAQRWPNQGSGVMSSLMWADGLVRAPENTAIKHGDQVAYISLEHLLG
jgi:molybdopterin molybdotransferase